MTPTIVKNVGGIRLSIDELAHFSRIPRDVLIRRLTAGMPVERACTEIVTPYDLVPANADEELAA